MALSDLVARYAARSAHLLLVEVPGSWWLRAATEAAVLRRGWRIADSPADADVLAVCGRPGPQLTQTADTVWDQLPGPRVRVSIEAVADMTTALDEAALAVSDTPAHRRDARLRETPTTVGADHAEMEMSPEGIPLAAGGNDRDGLELDVLHVRLGPVLRYWPAGLVLRCALQGDVITEAETHLVDNDHAPHQPAAQPPFARLAWWCDTITTVVALAGWQHAATRIRGIRDAFLAEHDPDETATALHHAVRRIERSRLLRWALRDVGPLLPDDVRRLGLAEHDAGDAWDRLMAMLELVRVGQATTDRAEAASAARTAAVPQLVTGLDLATARLVIASLGLSPVAARRAAGHA